MPSRSPTTAGTASGTWTARASLPAYPFGFGLSYTSFALEAATAELDGRTIRVGAGSVRNTGPRHGADVLQVYAGRRGIGQTGPPGRFRAVRHRTR